MPGRQAMRPTLFFDKLKKMAPKQTQCSQNLLCLNMLSRPQPVTRHERSLLMAAFAIESSSNNICAIHPASLSFSLSFLNPTHDVAHFMNLLLAKSYIPLLIGRAPQLCRDSSSCIAAALCRSFATTTMTGFQTGLAHSFHDLGLEEVRGLKKTCVSKLTSLAKSNKCDCAHASSKKRRRVGISPTPRQHFQTRQRRPALLLCTSHELIDAAGVEAVAEIKAD